MVRTVVGGGFWLAGQASGGYLAARAAGCPAGITEAGRSYARQVWLYGRWKAGLLKSPLVAKPGTSPHEGGIALDLPEPARSWMRANGARFGWVADRVPGEPWHFEFDGIDTTTEEDDMYTDADRARDQLTHQAVARMEQNLNAIKATVQKNNDALFATAPTSRGSSAGVLAVLGKVEAALASLAQSMKG